MPLPKPQSGQKQKEWISSCMSNETMKKEYPDNKQRLAICYSQWRSKNKSDELIEIIKGIQDDIIEIKTIIENKVVTPPLKNIRDVDMPKDKKKPWYK